MDNGPLAVPFAIIFALEDINESKIGTQEGYNKSSSKIMLIILCKHEAAAGLEIETNIWSKESPLKLSRDFLQTRDHQARIGRKGVAF